MNKLSEHIVLAAHRGDQAHAPENTMHAFERAIRLGVDMIETDIHMSSDGVMFIMHDDLVDRTTNGHGMTHQMTWKELPSAGRGQLVRPAVCRHHHPLAGRVYGLCAGHARPVGQLGAQGLSRGVRAGFRPAQRGWAAARHCGL